MTTKHEGLLQVTLEDGKYTIRDSRGRVLSRDPLLWWAKDKARSALHYQGKTFDGFQLTK